MLIQLDMPWVTQKTRIGLPTNDNEVYKEYGDMSNAELKERLDRRGLRHTGTKAVMAARLTENDDAQ